MRRDVWLWRHLASMSSNRTFTGEETSTCVFVLRTHVRVYPSGESRERKKNPAQTDFPFTISGETAQKTRSSQQRLDDKAVSLHQNTG